MRIKNRKNKISKGKTAQTEDVRRWLKLEYYAAERKKELLPFTTAWMELESIMLSEISQAVKDKYNISHL